MKGFTALGARAGWVPLLVGAGVFFSELRAEDRPAAASPRLADSALRRITPPSRPIRSESKQSNSSGKGAGSFWKTLAALGGIVVVIVLGARLLRKVSPNLSGGIPGEALQVLGKRAISRGQMVYLVRLGSRILVIGATSSGLQSLGEITDPVEVDYLSGLCRPREEGSSAITQGFRALFNRNSAAAEPSTNTAHSLQASRGVEPLGRSAAVSDASGVAEDARLEVPQAGTGFSASFSPGETHQVHV